MDRSIQLGSDSRLLMALGLFPGVGDLAGTLVSTHRASATQAGCPGRCRADDGQCGVGYIAGRIPFVGDRLISPLRQT
jgi:hypothetical protein